MRRVLLAAPIVLLAAGCTQYWARPGASRVELEAAKHRCDTEAITRFPLAPPGVVPFAGGSAVSGTQCTFGSTGPECSTYDDLEFDANASPRLEAFRGCMIDAGWLPARDDEQAGAITRMKHPPGPPSATRIQEARTWCEIWLRERRDAATIAVFNNSFDRCVATHSRDFG